MTGKETAKERETWVDNVKVIACILVVLGHFFQSMVKSEILPGGDGYLWFNQTIYYFHVPLFFICSGYLYQKYSRVESISAWGQNVWKKLLALGIPYFTFSTLTWALKTVFSDAVNDELGGLFETLFISPTAPYWYLYALFFLFLITPTFRDRKMAWGGLTAAAVLKLISLLTGGFSIYALSAVLSNEIWFVGGMMLGVWDFQRWMGKRTFRIGIVAGLLFLALSVMVYAADIDFTGMDFLLGTAACAAVVLMTASACRGGRQNKIPGFFSRYTMPVFLMHTIFAAALRSALFKLGITNSILHVVLGIGISFSGPVIAAVIMEKSFFLEFFLYPVKVIESRRNQNAESD